MHKMIMCLALCMGLRADSINDVLAQTCIKKHYAQVAKIANNEVILKDGSRFVWDDGLDKSYEQKLSNPDMNDAFGTPYPLSGFVTKRDEDTSRIRHLGFYKQIYGHTESEVKKQLVTLAWFENFPKNFVLITTANGVDKALTRVIARLKQLPKEYHKFLMYQDTFYWRNIADSPNLSPHSFAIALDINTKFSKYWLWDKKQHDMYHYENEIPLEIVRAFEEEGFIWGGRWWHYDTMHFEYRPEIICYAKGIATKSQN
ncbi:M15 family peptidase [Helicobacter jaachi]|uniref:M15 family peptidase n=1 Tax=Helicobacter jaachi TaxID=1677920 RepID=A0A4U8TFU7_9HELI|nr:M15 family metallopeptidase [Helicobacter jaachi]TLD97577.1 M15 family peptidase [Helicobacter jaachi]